MPLPKTRDMGKMMSFLKRDKPGMAHKQMLAIALNKTGKSKHSHKTVSAAIDKEMKHGK